MEPDVVFVYRMDPHQYVTMADLSDGSKWETYEMEQGDDFETFNHKERQVVSGKGFFINEEGMNEMVKRINHYIHKARNLKGELTQSGVVHLVTSESAAGSIRVGLESPKTVIGFPDAFSIGPLWKLAEQTGQSYRNEWLYDNINYEQEDYEYENKFANTIREIEDIAEHVPVYIWYSNNADEQTGLRFYLYLLRNKANDIFLLNTMDLKKKYCSIEDEPTVTHTAQMDPKCLRTIYENSKQIEPLSTIERNQFHQEWETLSESKEVLRIWREGIVGVREDYYDSLIIKTMEEMETDDFIKTGTILGEILSQTKENINIYFLEYRIRHLVYNGVLALKGIPKSMRHYSVKLRNTYTIKKEE